MQLHGANRASGNSSLGCVGRLLFGGLFGGTFTVLGGVFFFMALGSGAEELEARSWTPTPCTILKSDIESGNQAYRFAVQYSYVAGGTSRTGSTVYVGYDGGGEYAEAQRLAHTYPASAERTCYVDPDDPSEAVLQRTFPWSLLTLPFPLFFVLIGLGVIYFAIRGGRERDESKASISERADSNEFPGGRFGMAGFFGIFLLAGLGFLIPFFLLPAYRVVTAGGWVETPCRVIESEVWSHSGDDSTTYSINILYEYEVDGRAYRSNTYGFMGGSSSGYNAKDKVVQAHPPGRETVCWVNPDDPYDAALNRDVGWEFLIGLVPMVFVLVGVIGIYSSLFGNPFAGRSPGALSDRATMPLPRAPVGASSAGQVELKPESSRIGGCIGVAVFAAFWNGIISIFIYGALSEGSWFMGLFLIPFVLVGLGAIGGGIYTFLGLFNPEPKLILGTGHLPVGETTSLQYSLDGKVHVVKRLRILLEAREEVRYRRGTDTVTEESFFHREALLETTETSQMASGQVEVIIPFETMHSFESANNKIIWRVRIVGEIPRWPDINEAFDFTVLPLSPGEGT